ncbi:MAG: carbon-nitrogen hydrolase family protein [Myxococcales bacterium]|nr:carbon-nitrogen hydrolase family protein [Myxococcales bacterium]MCB9736109.1 carbon-nitrogen hydrolase family protein [Deltaproteobacteria bacterium]
MRVAAVQFRADKADKAGSLARLARFAAEAAADGAELVVLPEMAATGYLFRDRAHVAPVAEAPDGDTFRALAPVAREHGAWIVAGFPEAAAGGRFFNSAVVVDPRGGLAHVYRKTLLFPADRTWCEPGDSGYVAFDTDAGRVAVGICMDMNDDRFIRWLAKAGARALAFPTNWLDQGERVWEYWAWRMRPARGTAVVAANTWGREETTDFRGESAVLDDLTLRAAAPPTGDGVISAALP